MRVCIYGAGAIGGMLGFLLQKSGADVTLIARRNHYEEIKKNGLTFVSRDFNIEDTYSFSQPISKLTFSMFLFYFP